jgi:hypothetical protein
MLSCLGGCGEQYRANYDERTFTCGHCVMAGKGRARPESPAEESVGGSESPCAPEARTPLVPCGATSTEGAAE